MSEVKLKPREAFMLSALQLSIQKHKSLQSAILHLIRGISCPVSKSRTKKKLQELYNSHLKYTKAGKDAEYLDQVLDDIGWNW
jgi:hypothetical protein